MVTPPNGMGPGVPPPDDPAPGVPRPDDESVPEPAGRNPGGRELPHDRPELCDVCGSDRLGWVRCKLVCGNCRSIVMSCADL